ncbi:hypothetical protein DICPUDRAFT_38852 [Dictyostelium purpureum]|uniref:Tr-type G domain-containing protein n=1 Tax=Dictyostelium purpureum TaxID=5786 RepID=F0ZVB5_DICPU|nr:uncharacterized protein DICPUDRAFT_38852 [Dictyostelium purpureum]EGC32105.1 hypothetical protein DICPUDRAFT_38852 [Dictyostelium purpureum]|eukprot:XP_003291355.1 hypothetical protein DICPUDRAFT_38852 [Dictyostelium purpureum]
MVSNEKIKKVITISENIRNISIVGQINNGKTSIFKRLVKKAGVVNDGTVVEEDKLNSEINEITTKLQFNSIFFTELSKEYYINLIDTPGHLDLKAQVVAGLRITDGSLFVVDGFEGFSFGGESIVRPLISENNKPTLFINKLDHFFIDPQIELEQVYLALDKSVDLFNVNIECSAFSTDFSVDPKNGSVAFGSALDGWAFRLDSFANRYSQKHNIPKQSLLKRLWGNNYYDDTTKKWTSDPISSANGSKLERSFCQFILRPIYQIIRAIMDDDMVKLKQINESLNIKISDQQLEVLKGKELVKEVLCLFLPLEETVLSMMANNIPSPLYAQKYRVNGLYEGSMDDEYAKSISFCNRDGPLVIFISTLSVNSFGQINAIGRIFSGTIKKSEKIAIINRKNEVFTTDKYGINLIINNDSNMEIDECTSGNIVCLSGLKSSCLSNSFTATSGLGKSRNIIRYIKLPTYPILSKSISPNSPNDLPALMEGLKKLAVIDQVANISFEETGEILVCGTGQFHLNVLFKVLKEIFIPSVDINISDLIIPYRESVSQESSLVCCAKSPNKHSRVYMKAQPLQIDVAVDIQVGSLDPSKYSQKEFSDKLCKDYGWEKLDIKNIWAFGPEDLNTNLFMGSIQPMDLQDIKDGLIQAFNWVIKEGPICGNKLWGVRFNLGDVYKNQVPIVRGGYSFVIPTTRRALYASQLSASPVLLEPIYNSQINVPHAISQDVFNLVKRKRGSIITEYPSRNSQKSSVIIQLPVIESVGFENELKQLSDKTFNQHIFSHWSQIGGVVGIDDISTNIAMNIRTKKGLPPTIPLYTEYHDKP